MAGGGAGAMAQMIASIQYNRSLQRRIPYFKMKHDYTVTIRKNELDFKKATPEQLAAIRQKVIRLQKRDRIKSILTLLVAGIIAWWVISSVLGYFF